jgi:hypothetical protein
MRKWLPPVNPLIAIVMKNQPMRYLVSINEGAITIK